MSQNSKLQPSPSQKPPLLIPLVLGLLSMTVNDPVSEFPATLTTSRNRVIRERIFLAGRIYS